MHVGDLAFQRILALVLVLAAGWIFWHPTDSVADAKTFPPEGTEPLLLRLIFCGVGFYGVGFYGGFIQAGLGFITLAVTSSYGLDLIRSNAVKVSLVLMFTPLALAIFAYNGRVDWATGFLLAAGTFVGALVGVRLQVLKGERWVRGVLTVVVVAFAVRLLIGG